MTRLEKLEASVEELSQEEFSRFSEWFAELQAERWDRRIEQDAKAGRLDAVLAEARAEIAAGKVRPL
jgi:hypothetical protein